MNYTELIDDLTQNEFLSLDDKLAIIEDVAKKNRQNRLNRVRSKYRQEWSRVGLLGEPSGSRSRGYGLLAGLIAIALLTSYILIEVAGRM